MGLPVKTTTDDIDAICTYLATKPAGATATEARAVLGNRVEARKLSALKYWGLLGDSADERLVLTPSGRELAKGSSWRAAVLASVVRNVPAYLAIVERAFHSNEESASVNDVAAHWFQHFRQEVSDSDEVLKDQALCFLHVAKGAELGDLVLGRGGNATRLQFDREKVASFIHSRTAAPPVAASDGRVKERPVPATTPAVPASEVDLPPVRRSDGTFLQRGLEVDCYILNRRLGAGFSAEVWSAKVMRVPPGVDLSVGQEVAIKFYTTNALAGC